MVLNFRDRLISNSPSSHKNCVCFPIILVLFPFLGYLEGSRYQVMVAWHPIQNNRLWVITKLALCHWATITSLPCLIAFLLVPKVRNHVAYLWTNNNSAKCRYRSSRTSEAPHCSIFFTRSTTMSSININRASSWGLHHRIYRVENHHTPTKYPHHGW